MAAAEKMDVDFSEGAWSGPGEREGEATEMETSSPWDAEAAAGQAPPAEPRVGWASFEAKAEPTAEENWADFSSFSDISAGNGPRSSSPVAMDTSEVSRSSNYVVGGDGPKPAPESSSSSPGRQGAKSAASVTSGSPGGDMKVESVDLSSSQETVPDSTSQPSPTATTTSTPTLPVQSPAVSTSPASPKVPAADVGVSSTSSEAESPEPAAAVEAGMEPKEPVAASGVAEAAGVTAGVTVPNSMAVDSTTAAASPPQQNAKPSNEALCSKPQDDDEEDGDLGANFNFLMGSGLMRKSPGAGVDSSKVKAGAGDQAEAGVEATQEPDTTNSADLEAARAQAKEMMERYDSASTVTPPENTVQNGPV